MRFLVDAQLAPALALCRQATGHWAAPVADRGMEAASDAMIWDDALQVSAMIITKNEDFAHYKAISGAASRDLASIAEHETERPYRLAREGLARHPVSLKGSEDLIETV